MLSVSCSRKAICKVGKWRRRGKLNHSLDLIFEKNRQHDNIVRHDFEQCGADRNSVARNIIDQPASLVGGALANQAFAEFNRGG